MVSYFDGTTYLSIYFATIQNVVTGMKRLIRRNPRAEVIAWTFKLCHLKNATNVITNAEWESTVLDETCADLFYMPSIIHGQILTFKVIVTLHFPISQYSIFLFLNHISFTSNRPHFTYL